MYFSLIDQGQPQRKELLNKIVAHDRVVHLGSLLGDYHYVVVFLCECLGEVREFLKDIFSGAGDVFSDKLLAPRTGVTYFQRKYLDTNVKKPLTLSLEKKGDTIVLDEFDERLLSLLGAKPFESLRKLASGLGAPYSTIERRVRRLRESGVINGFRYKVDTKLIGMHSYRLLVMKKGICNSTRERLYEFCKSHRQVTFLIESIGAWDFEIGVEASDASTVTAVVEELYGLCGMRIAWVKVLMEDKSYKCSYFPMH